MTSLKRLRGVNETEGVEEIVVGEVKKKAELAVVDRV